ncbi:MAG: biopolymer transporter ExbD [Candidatus Latescibacterota bacterium]|jgi:biopolymer transport protein ExbD
MAFERQQKIESKVPTSSMADIAFLLLIFFMTTTIFKMEDGLPVTLPRAETAQKQKREMIMRIWINRDGVISINDKLVTVDNVEAIIVTMMQEKPNLIVAFNADDQCPYNVVSDVMEELKKANAVRVSFTSDPETSTQPSRRK